jgi:hypothetical protein
MSKDHIQRLPFFPQAQSGESLYSVCARFHRQSGYLDSKYTSLFMFGHGKVGTRQDFILGISNLYVASNGTINADEKTVRERTVLRSYLPFMRSSQRQAAIAAALDGFGGHRVRSATGLTWNHVTIEHELRACPKCAAEQISEGGFPYWQTSLQLPGVWMCTKHEQPLLSYPRRGVKNTAWICTDINMLSPGWSETSTKVHQRLNDLARCIDWLSNHTSIDTDALSAMTRTRLHIGGLAKSEVKLSKPEQNSLISECNQLLGAPNIPHYAFLRSEKWLRQTLFDRRAAHPVRWAVLLTLSGDVESDLLSKQYAVALERMPDLDLFENPGLPRLAKAPKKLYDVLSAPISKAAAAKQLQLPPSYIDGWLRRDKTLKKHWMDSGYLVKLKAAKVTLQGAVLARPNAKRSEIIKLNVWAVRWLAENAPEEIDKVLPPVMAMFDPQKRFDF